MSTTNVIVARDVITMLLKKRMVLAILFYIMKTLHLEIELYCYEIALTFTEIARNSRIHSRFEECSSLNIDAIITHFRVRHPLFAMEMHAAHDRR